MHPPLKKALLAEFEQALQHRFPQFAAFDADRKLKIWSWKAAPGLRFFVLLQARDRLEQFMVEVAWAETDEFPWGAMGRTDPALAQGRERLGQLVVDSGDEFMWDVIPEKTARQDEDLTAIRKGHSDSIPKDPPLRELLPRLTALVNDALDKFQSHALPLFQRVAASHGVTVPDKT